MWCRSVVQYVMENVLMLSLSQAVRYLKHPAYALRDKQLLKRELATDLVKLATNYPKWFSR